jgi:hypothetical protein
LKVSPTLPVRIGTCFLRLRRCVDVDNEALTKKTVTGKLKVEVIMARNVLGKKTAKHDAHVAIRIDNIQRFFVTKTRSKLIWNETFDINIEKVTSGT